MTRNALRYAIKETPARMRLAALIDQKNVAEEQLRALEPPASRLRGIIGAEVVAKARLDAIEADHADKMVAWASAGTGIAPTADTEGRSIAESELRQAAAAATAARAPLADIAEQQSRHGRRLREIAPQIHAAALLVLVEEAGDIMSELEATARDFSTRIQKASRIISVVTDAANHSNICMDTLRPVYAGVEKLNDRFNRTMSELPFAQSRFGHDDDWALLAKELLTNPMAVLEDTAH